METVTATGKWRVRVRTTETGTAETATATATIHRRNSRVSRVKAGNTNTNRLKALSRVSRCRQRSTRAAS